MGIFTKIPQNTFDELQLEAGMLLYDFDPNNPAAPDEDDIITATTGGISVSCVPTTSDFGEDIDNCPVNMMELKRIDSWECTMSFTALSVSADVIKLALGAADASGETYALTSDVAIVTGKTYYTRSGTSPNYTYTKVTSPVVGSIGTYYEMTAPDSTVTPRRNLKQSDFRDLWWVGDRSDGGFAAVKIMNALSTGGFSLQSTKSGKGQLACTITGHVSIDAQDVVPMEFYTVEGSES